MLGKLIAEPAHSLIVQSYQPREMTAGLLNADGFGIAWYDRSKAEEPFIYRSELPIWNDVNLPSLQRYVSSDCFMAGIRSATPGQGVGIHNCPPYSYGKFCFIHNGFIENFRRSLYRPLRSLLKDEFYHLIHGSTDSEHIFALLMQFYDEESHLSNALHRTLEVILDLSAQYGVRSALNVIASDGTSLVVSRYASTEPFPSLYFFVEEGSTIVASESLWSTDGWQAIKPNMIMSFSHSV